MNTLEITAEIKQENGKTAAKAARKQGKVPAVIYGGKNEPVNIVLDKAELMSLYRNSDYKANALFTIDVNGQKEVVITQALQREVLTRSIEHIDFLRINEKDKITTEVPVNLVGTAAGQKMGGVVIKTLEDIKIACLPQDIPVEIKADISPLGLGSSLFVKNLPEDEKIDYISDPSASIAYVEIPRSERSAMAQQTDEETPEES